MQEENQKYGIYIPELKIFVNFNGSKDKFDELLQAAGYYYNKKLECSQNQAVNSPSYDDFDDIIREVNNTPYSDFSTELK